MDRAARPVKAAGSAVTPIAAGTAGASRPPKTTAPRPALIARAIFAVTARAACPARSANSSNASWSSWSPVTAMSLEDVGPRLTRRKIDCAPASTISSRSACVAVARIAATASPLAGAAVNSSSSAAHTVWAFRPEQRVGLCAVNGGDGWRCWLAIVTVCSGGTLGKTVCAIPGLEQALETIFLLSIAYQRLKVSHVLRSLSAQPPNSTGSFVSWILQEKLLLTASFGWSRFRRVIPPSRSRETHIGRAHVSKIGQESFNKPRW